MLPNDFTQKKCINYLKQASFAIYCFQRKNKLMDQNNCKHFYFMYENNNIQKNPEWIKV